MCKACNIDRSESEHDETFYAHIKYHEIKHASLQE